jgi:hypothetical protein
MVTVSRASGKSPNTGDDFDFDRDVDTSKMFEKVSYKGKLLKDLFEEAEKDDEKMKELKKTFAVRHVDDDTAKPLLREVPTFNYFELFKPLSPAEIKSRVIGHSTPRDRNNDSDDNTKSTKHTDLKEDETPF